MTIKIESLQYLKKKIKIKKIINISVTHDKGHIDMTKDTYSLFVREKNNLSQRSKLTSLVRQWTLIFEIQSFYKWLPI